MYKSAFVSPRTDHGFVVPLPPQMQYISVVFLLEIKPALVWRMRDLNRCQDPVMRRNRLVWYSEIYLCKVRYWRGFSKRSRAAGGGKLQEQEHETTSFLFIFLQIQHYTACMYTMKINYCFTLIITKLTIIHTVLIVWS